MQKCEGSVFWRECLWKFKCDVRQNSCLYKKKQMKRRSEVEDASSRKSKRRLLANRRGGFFFIQKEPLPFSKVGRLSQKLDQSGITRRAVCPDVSSLVTFGLSSLENHEPNPDLNPGFQKVIIPVCRHSSHAQSASRKLRTVCQKARNWHCSSIHRLPTNSARIVPVEEAKFL